MIVIRDSKTFFLIWLKKYVNQNLKHEIEFIIKSIESLAENKINEIEQLLLKYKYGNNNYEHGK